MALFACQNLSVGYEGKAVAKDINFEINPGDYLCIVGENGSGKSTLLKTMLGLMPALGGEITTDDGLLKTEIGYLPQQTVVQKDFPASVREIVMSGFLNQSDLRPFYTKKERQRALENMEKMGIGHLIKKCYRELSGGQQQRVLLTRALCATRKMLILDEPAAGLDPKAGTDMYEILKSLNKNDAITIMMISHDVSAVMNYASHILHVGNARVFFAKKDEYLKSEPGRAFVSMGGELQ